MCWLFKKKGLFQAPNGKNFSPAKPPTEYSIQLAEEELGFKLPHPLIDIYMKYGNGGYGPGYGLIGVSGGHKDCDGGLDLVSRYKEQLKLHSEKDEVPWPVGLLPICNYGCGLYSCVMCMDISHPVYLWTCDEFHDKLQKIPFDGHEIRLETKTFESWVSSWKQSEKPSDKT